MLSKRTRHTIFSVLGALIVGYFLYHTIQGDRGWFAMLRLQNEVKTADETLAQLKEEHKQLSHREQLMKPGGVDPDLLDEEARKTLNYSKPNEIIILTPPNKKDDGSSH